MELERRLELLETRNALLDLISAYAQAFDNQDPELLRDTFHADGALDLGEAWGRHDGIDAIVAAGESFWTASPNMHHWMANPLLDLDLEAGTAKGSVALNCICTYLETGTAHLGGRYRDTFRRIDGRWWIAERIFDLQFYVPLPDWKPTLGSEATMASAGA